MTAEQQQWDAIIIGSGMGGLSCAAALARSGLKVLVLEQHYAPGGLTQTFHRSGFRWDVGVHYLGEMGPGGDAIKILDWLSGGAITFAPMNQVYDILHFPGNFIAHFETSEAALRRELVALFPQSASSIDAFLAALDRAARTAPALFAGRALPAPIAWLTALWNRRRIGKYWGRTGGEVLDELIADPKLRAVLLAQRGNYGGTTADSFSFGIQAVIMRHYFNGAFYPVGGAKAFADGLIPTIEQAGGAIKLKAKVTELVFDKARVVGVRLNDGTEFRAPRVFSDTGARNTVEMLPAELRDTAWAREIRSFAPSVCHLSLYLGLEGDIAAKGASSSNHWFHNNWELDGGVWTDPQNNPDPPNVFVSFPSLKDPAHDPGERQRHTAEIIAMTDWGVYERWKNTTHRTRPADYAAAKAAIEENLFNEFARQFLALAPLVVVRELSTPLTTSGFIGSEHGAIYGLEVSPRRFLSRSLRAKTPVPGLYLTGQDVVSPGVAGAMMGGVLAAAAVEPRIFRRLQ